MDIFEVFIDAVYDVKEYHHVVVALLDTNCYGCEQSHVPVVFDKHVWERVKSRKRYLETEGHPVDSLKYFESLTDEEYYHRFERKLSEFSDEELVEELNKRANSLYSKIQFNVKFEVKLEVNNGAN